MAEDKSFIQSLKERIMGGGASMSTAELARLAEIENKHTELTDQLALKKLYARRHAFRKQPSAYNAIKYWCVKQNVDAESIHTCIDDLYEIVLKELGRLAPSLDGTMDQPTPVK